MYRIDEFLSPAERLEAMRFGGVAELARRGMSADGLRKSAAEGSLDILGTVLKTCALVGAPVGIVWYAMSDALKRDSAATRRMKATLDHYNTVVADGRRRLQSQGADSAGSPDAFGRGRGF